MVLLGLTHIHDAGIGNVLRYLCKFRNVNYRDPNRCNPLHQSNRIEFI